MFASLANRHKGLADGLAALSAVMLAVPAAAQNAAPDVAPVVAAIEADIDANATEAGALALARKLSAAQNLSGAASALEAFLIGNARSEAARAEYAVTLCRLDDRSAGKFEGAKLIAMGAPATMIAAVTQACGALPDPARLALGEELPQ